MKFDDLPDYTVPTEGVATIEPSTASSGVEKQRRAIRVIDRRDDRHTRRIATDKEAAKTARKIRELRTEKGVPGFIKHQHVVDTVIAAFKKRGEFYHDGVRGYVFLHDRRVLLPLDLREQGLEMALREYRLYPNEFVTKQVIHALRLEALETGLRTNIHAFAACSPTGGCVYIYDFDGGVLRVMPGADIEHLDNGVDGVLFAQNPQWEAFGVEQYRADIGLDWLEWLLSGVTFAPAGTLTDADQRLLFRVWVLTLFFPQLFPTRPILAMIGEKGSGKSSLLRRLGQLLFGRNFNVATLTAKPDDFDAAITTDPFVVADNADDAPGWLPDRLAVAATGGTIKRRKYYTTNDMAEYPIRAWIALTSRTPNFQREDVAERLVPLYMARLAKFGAEHRLLGDVQSARNVLMAAVLRDVATASECLRESAAVKFSSSFRMADFADFALKVAPAFTTGAEIQATLGRLEEQQVAFASEGDFLLVLIDQWLGDEGKTVNIDRRISPTDLERELCLVAGNRTVPWASGNSQSFSQYLRNRKGNLTRLYGFEERSGHAREKFLTFRRRRAGDVGDVEDHKSVQLTDRIDTENGGEK